MSKKWVTKIDDKGNEIAEEVEVVEKVFNFEEESKSVKGIEKRRQDLLLKKEIETQEKNLIDTIITDIESRKYSLQEAVQIFPEYQTLIEKIYEQRKTKK